VLAELARLAVRGVAPAAPAAAFARRLRTVPTRSRGDAAVLEAARRLNATVVTADRELARRLGEAGVPVLVPRGRQTLARRAGTTPPTLRTRRRSAAPPNR